MKTNKYGVSDDNIVWFKDCSYQNKHLVGGKCSSLGELFRLSDNIGFQIADGFAITTKLYDQFLQYNHLTDQIEEILADLDCNNIEDLEKASKKIKQLFNSRSVEFSEKHIEMIIDAYDDLCIKYEYGTMAVAVRSSAIAEDLDNASFAGQQDTFLNVSGDIELLKSVKLCFASLFNSRAISYRKTHNIQMSDVKISVAIQKMVRSDIGSAGVAFSIDPETGYDRAIVINSAFGLGELVVSGGVKPDEYIIDKRVLREMNADRMNNMKMDPLLMKIRGDKRSKIVYSTNRINNLQTVVINGTHEIQTTDKEFESYSLSNENAILLGKYVLQLEEEYSSMFGKQLGVDVEWAVDGEDHMIYIIQTRPETIHSNDGQEQQLEICKYILQTTPNLSDCLIQGVAVGDKISTGNVRILKSMDEHDTFIAGDILVTEMTTPDWEPLMKISSGIITNKGGRTCHAAIVARELGLNAVVGTGNATQIFGKLVGAGQDFPVTISCADGEVGKVYNGILPFNVDKIQVNNNLKLPVKLMMNVGNPESCFHNAIIPNSGVGLARLEFIINNYIKVHPLALCNYPNLPQPILDKVSHILKERTDGKQYFITKLARGIAKIASTFYPNDVIVRLSDFKSNEYKNLVGGELYEPTEENPMIGWRGASRYYSADYEKAFELECKAIQYARDVMQMTNVIVMIPFCRTPKECRQVLDTMAKYGLTRGVNGLQVYLMCEIPSNVIEADMFSPLIDGVSIGGNDLLQLTLGVDRDSERITYLSDDQNLSYRRMISMAIKTYKENGVKIGFCGQQPSDSIEFCQFLIGERIDSISVTPDCALKTIKNLGL